MLPLEALAKVNPFHVRVVAESFRSTRAEDLSVVDNVRPIGHRKGLTHIVVGYQNSESLRASGRR